MTRADAGTVESNLRRLDASTCAALVADLWAARGYETTRKGGVVVATREGESVTLYPTVSGLLRPVSAPDRPVDVVVAPGGGRGAAALAARLDATLVDATDLREMLWYAVDRSVATALCERHLGAAPAELRPPLRARTREGLSRAIARASAATVLTAVVVLALVALVAGAGIAAISGTAPGASAASGDAGGSSADGSGDVVLGPNATDAGTLTPMATPTRTPGATTTAASGPVPVPGVSRDGLQNLTALAAAHRRAVGTRSHTLWIDVYRPRGGRPNATRVQRDVDVAVAGGRYLLTATVEDDRSRTVVREVYHDGIDWYVADVNGTEATYRRASLGDVTRGTEIDVDPFELRRTLVARYLSTPRTAYEGRVTDESRSLHRVVGHGRPPSFDAVRNYSVVALIDDSGLVRSIDVEYTVVAASGEGNGNVTYSRRFEVTYDRMDRTTVEAPAWYVRQFVGEDSGASSGRWTGAGTGPGTGYRPSNP